MKKRLLSILLTLALCLALLSVTALAASDPENYVFDISEGSVTIENGTNENTVKVTYGGGSVDNIDPSQVITVTGSTTGTRSSSNKLAISTATPVTIKASNLSIDNANTQYSHAMTLEFNGAKVKLILEGANIFKGGNDKAGIAVNADETLTIQGDGSVTAVGGANIGGAGIGGDGGQNCGTVIINSGTVIATGCSGGAGIGGGEKYINNGAGGGTIIINGGKVTATGGSRAADIGGGYDATDNGTLSGSGKAVITATNSKVTANTDGFNGTINGVSYGVVNYCVTVNDVEVTSSNKDNVLDDGKVRYDSDTNTLYAEELSSAALNVVGNGSTNVVISSTSGAPAVGTLMVTGAKDVAITEKSSAPAINGQANITCTGSVKIENQGNGQAVGGTLTVTGAKNVAVFASCGRPAISGAADISCTGNVSITNDAGMAVNGALTVNGVEGTPAQNVTVTANCFNGPAISGDYYSGVGANITCSGNIFITNSSGFCVGSKLSVNGAKDVTVTANGSSPAVSGPANITCSGNVKITNAVGMATGSTLTVTGAKDVTVTANSSSPAICSTAYITCSGNVEITNNGGGYAVSDTLTVDGALDVEVNAKAGGPAITNNVSIACSGNVSITNESGFAVGNTLTVTSAKDVTVTANSTSPAISLTATITCSGDVDIVNSAGRAVGGELTYKNTGSDHKYVVKTGSSLDTLRDYAIKEANETFGPETLDVSVVKIITAHILTKTEANPETCTEDGNSAYWTCSVCGKYFSDENGNTEIEKDSWIIESTGHTTGEWEHSSTRHLRCCIVCEAELERAYHTFSGNTCTVCGYIRPVYVFTYLPVIEDTDNGNVTVSPQNPTADSKVTITPAPDAGYEVDQVIVTDQNGNPVKVTDNGDGTYTFTQPAGKVNVKVTFANKINVFFVDVPANAYYNDAVYWAVENSITNGVDTTHFAPNEPCTRAQMVTFLWRAAGCPEPKGMSSFTDVPADTYYATAVAWAVENGITSGVGDSKFAPDEVCTRAQMATFLCRIASGKAVSSTIAFTDVSADAYYAEAIQWAVENGITLGTGDGTTFSPNEACTRAQIVTFLYRFFVK